MRTLTVNSPASFATRFHCPTSTLTLAGLTSEPLSLQQCAAVTIQSGFPDRGSFLVTIVPPHRAPSRLSFTIQLWVPLTVTRPPTILLPLSLTAYRAYRSLDSRLGFPSHWSGAAGLEQTWMVDFYKFMFYHLIILTLTLAAGLCRFFRKLYDW